MTFQLRTVCALAVACVSPMAAADVSLTLTPVSTQCVTVRNDAGGTTRTAADCGAGPSFDVFSSVTTSGSAQSFIELTYAFTYRDDGLALPSAVVLDTADYVGLGGTVSGARPRVNFETATLAVDVTSSSGPNPLGPGYAITAFTTGAPAGATRFADGYLLFGANDRADSFSGTLTVSIGVTAFGFNDLASVKGVTVASSVAAIPEPSTYTLLLAGLVPALLWGRRSRNKATAGR